MHNYICQQLLCTFIIQCCVHCCGLKMSHVSFSFLQLSVSDCIVSSRSSLLDRRPMFVLVSLFLVCLPVFLLLLPAEYRNVLMCFSLCVPHKTTFCFSGCLAQLFLLHHGTGMNGAGLYQDYASNNADPRTVQC